MVEMTGHRSNPVSLLRLFQCFPLLTAAWDPNHNMGEGQYNVSYIKYLPLYEGTQPLTSKFFINWMAAMECSRDKNFCMGEGGVVLARPQ